ncbi:RmlC-like cupin domain-containing protein [Fomitopsis serialis]|uniref:RmlC-like cupin domain-containing protein n=1 Tax=Fomitopsis serialis TaxID=139415 RepID=UPI0020087065|nr:RmlC-like cupin domain-containing protein [Neoantrodia serialis]KAH9914349.1 RmlC-like cupin domain-containing protein [Neoantrodia serialis]
MSPPLYPIPNSTVIPELRLQKHPEGGYFAETDRQSETVPSPFVGGAPRSLATTIYYLLTPDEKNGVFHMNKSATMHVLHQGRAEYVLITPPATPGSPPKLEKKVMGPNLQAGEVLQLLVPSGIWKMSRLLPDDLSAAADPEKRDRVGCLITEVVFPGFAWEDHAFLTRTELEKLYGGSGESKEWAAYVKNG